MIFNRRKFDHISDALEELHWLPMEARIEYKILLLTYKALNGQGPEYLVDLFKFRQFPRATRAADDHLTSAKPNTKQASIGDEAFFFSSRCFYGTIYHWSYDLVSQSIVLKTISKPIFLRSSIQTRNNYCSSFILTQ